VKATRAATAARADAAVAIPKRPSAAEVATVTINSDIPDAGSEIDGGFINNTPSTSKLAPGILN